MEVGDSGCGVSSYWFIHTPLQARHASKTARASDYPGTAGVAPATWRHNLRAAAGAASLLKRTAIHQRWRFIRTRTTRAR